MLRIEVGRTLSPTAKPRIFLIVRYFHFVFTKLSQINVSFAALQRSSFSLLCLLFEIVFNKHAQSWQHLCNVISEIIGHLYELCVGLRVNIFYISGHLTNSFLCMNFCDKMASIIHFFTPTLADTSSHSFVQRHDVYTTVHIIVINQKSFMPGIPSLFVCCFFFFRERTFVTFYFLCFFCTELSWPPKIISLFDISLLLLLLLLLLPLLLQHLYFFLLFSLLVDLVSLIVCLLGGSKF